jgi:apolipoprotein N-acyltransferase
MTFPSSVYLTKVAAFTSLSFIIVALGQPAFVPFFGTLAASMGFGCFGWVLLSIPSKKKKFLLAFIWFGCVQAIELAWLLSHPYSYIYGVYLFLIIWMAASFGMIGMFIERKNLMSLKPILGISGIWVLCEWSRLYFLSGFPFNPIGLSLTSSLWGLQAASVAGVYGLSFWVMFTNLCFLRIFVVHKKMMFYSVAALPYIFGQIQLSYQGPKLESAAVSRLNALLVQTAFPVEENLPFKSFAESVAYVKEEWRAIFKMIAPYSDKEVDLIVLPEYVVPYSAYATIYAYEDVYKDLEPFLHKQALDALPQLKEPLAWHNGSWFVSNAYICQALANLFKADVLVGMQDNQYISDKDYNSYSSAFYFWPEGKSCLRYDKQVLLPIAECIPFECLKDLAKDYGITGSFTKGNGAKVFPGCKTSFGLSICYEEAYGHLIRENRVKGANLLVNLTSDVWYPDSKLPKQHFDHARLRSVENGVPVLRACNTGITGAFDSLGRIIEATSENDEWVRQVLPVQVPLYHYATLYAATGDALIMALSTLMAIGLFYKRS